MPLAPQHQFIQRFAAAAQSRIDQIPVSASLRLRERSALATVRVGRATNRSVIGSMTQFGYAVDAWLERRLADDLDHPEALEALGLWLCDTPCSPLRTTWPWLEAELLLAGHVMPGRRGVRSR